MSYTTFFGDTFEDEHDENLCHKFGDTYKYFKKQYPGLHKLPDEEIGGICGEFKKSPCGDTFEKSLARTNQYIQNRMPDWQKKYINPQGQQSAIEAQKNNRKIENDLLMNGLDTMYGMNRTINGMSFGGLDWLGNKFGFDSQMNEYLNLKDEQNRNLTRMAGSAAELGGAALTGKALATTGYNQANMMYNGYKIGKNYDKLRENPYQGNAQDVIARMKNHNGEPVVLQRGEAIPGTNGEVIVHGKTLGRETGTIQNFGLDKGIYRHGINRADAQRIPRAIQQTPIQTNDYGQHVYITRGAKGELKIVTSPTNRGTTVSSIYYPKK